MHEQTNKQTKKEERGVQKKGFEKIYSAILFMKSIVNHCAMDLSILLFFDLFFLQQFIYLPASPQNKS